MILLTKAQLAKKYQRKTKTQKIKGISKLKVRHLDLISYNKLS